MNKSGHQKYPFKSITIEGVTQKVTSNVVLLKGTPSGWGGSFRWKVSDKTPEQFAARIMNLLQAEPAGSPSSSSTKKSMSRDAAALEQTAGFNTPGYTSPRSASPGNRQAARDRSRPVSPAQKRNYLRSRRSPSQYISACRDRLPRM